MALLYRIYNNRLFPIENVPTLGWSTDAEYPLPPDEYFSRGEFVIHRGCFGIGDWGIITAMPRILKEHYPGCKVYITSEALVETLYGPAEKNPQNVWGMWSSPYQNLRHCFVNNPYVDAFIDTFDGEIYHDHFRIKNHLVLNDPLVLQMLRFHKIDLNLDADYLPEIYFSEQELEEFGAFKKQHFGDDEYGSFSFRYLNEGSMKKVDYVENMLQKYKGLPFMYFFNTDVGADFTFNKVLNAKGLDVRLLMYMASHAKVCTGTQTGLYDMCCRYTNVDIVASAFKIEDINEHYLPAINYNFV